jgi:hypothetical protein
MKESFFFIKNSLVRAMVRSKLIQIRNTGFIVANVCEFLNKFFSLMFLDFASLPQVLVCEVAQLQPYTGRQPRSRASCTIVPKILCLFQ